MISKMGPFFYRGGGGGVEGKVFFIFGKKKTQYFLVP